MAKLNLPDMIERLNNVYCVVQELENAGVRLPTSDYDCVYRTIEEVREFLERQHIVLSTF